MSLLVRLIRHLVVSPGRNQFRPAGEHAYEVVMENWSAAPYPTGVIAPCEVSILGNDYVQRQRAARTVEGIASVFRKELFQPRINGTALLGIPTETASTGHIGCNGLALPIHSI